MWIAKLRVILVHADGRREQGQIAVGQPYQDGTDVDLKSIFGVLYRRLDADAP